MDVNSTGNKQAGYVIPVSREILEALSGFIGTSVTDDAAIPARDVNVVMVKVNGTTTSCFIALNGSMIL